MNILLMHPFRYGKDTLHIAGIILQLTLAQEGEI